MNREWSCARNTGWHASYGQVVMFLDDDDRFLPGKISAQVRTMKEAGPACTANNANYIERVSGVFVLRGSEICSGYCQLEAMKRNLFIHKGSNLMVTRAALDRTGGFRTYLT